VALPDVHKERDAMPRHRLDQLVGLLVVGACDARPRDDSMILMTQQRAVYSVAASSIQAGRAPGRAWQQQRAPVARGRRGGGGTVTPDDLTSDSACAVLDCSPLFLSCEPRGHCIRYTLHIYMIVHRKRRVRGAVFGGLPLGG
jgi:hypothetical protein